MQIRGPAGVLEARYDAAASPGGPQAVLCHPHPEYGGSLHDGVLERVAGALLDAGVGVLRFNFRGVGGSDGGYDGGPGEVQDLLAAVAWLSETHPGALWLGGYSFGAWVAWQALGQGCAPRHVLLIAPPVGSMEFPERDVGCPVDVLIGDRDDFADPVALSAWRGISLHTVTGADHFFAGHLDTLSAKVRALLGPDPTART